MPRGLHVAGFDPLGLVYLAVVLLVIFAPLLFARLPSSGDSDPDSDEGPGRGPRRRPKPPSGPRGGIPLPDAVQASQRLRDHGRLGSPRPRGRHVHSPQRRRQRTIA